VPRTWELYAGHRARLTEALATLGRNTGGRLCLLGAGRCNDVDLEALAAIFTEIHLVDLDAAAIGEAIARQPAVVRAKLVRHAPVDLSGFSKRLKKWKAAPPTVQALDATTAAAARSLVSSLPGPFEVAASACVLTQMSFHLREALGEDHPALVAARTALVNLHVGTLVGLTSATGASLFVSDVLSSTHYPLDALAPDANLGVVLRDAVGSGKFYHAAHPELVAVTLRAHAQGANVELLEPWLWTAEHQRTYLVYACTLTR
jgi:hypothetical protein